MTPTTPSSLRLLISCSSVILALAVSSCRATTQTDAESSVKADEVPQTPVAPIEKVAVVYVTGGFNSCGDQPRDEPHGMDMAPRASQLRDMIEQKFGHKVRIVLSCFDGMNSARLIWLSSNHGTMTTRWNNPTPIFDEIRDLSENWKHPVFVIGHSYGGWLVSNFAAYVGSMRPQATSQVIWGLYTLDPVSPYHCDQMKYATTLARTAARIGAPLIGAVSWVANFREGNCERHPPQLLDGDGTVYPRDVQTQTPQDLWTNIAHSTRLWLNSWQGSDALHSSVISGSRDGVAFPINYEVTYSRPFIPGITDTPHTRIDTEDEVWNRITGSIEASLGSRNEMGLTTGEQVGSDGEVPVAEVDWPKPPRLAVKRVKELYSFFKSLNAEEAKQMKALVSTENHEAKLSFMTKMESKWKERREPSEVP